MKKLLMRARWVILAAALMAIGQTNTGQGGIDPLSKSRPGNFPSNSITWPKE